MANIFEQRSEPLHQLLDRAQEDGATVVIPELQRPYVWRPNQVTLLIDSLIRGWPFGTLLVWKVNHEDLEIIPHRPFWQTVDRTEEDDSSQVRRKNPPGTFLMVLDGQQRVQSLVLALAGDDSGFVLEDRDWFEEVREERPRGRQKHPHWSKAGLCFDLDEFLAEYERGQKLFSVDFRKVLVWAVTDPTEGRSKWPKPTTYIEPLRSAYTAEGQRRLIRLSRLWREAQPNPNLKERDFRRAMESLLDEYGVPEDRVKRLLDPMGELMTTLRDVKLAKITYLELATFDPALSTRDEYNDAIVNIFTRLNTAGRTLTREQITFAWLKVNWDAKGTDGKSAAACFDELLAELRDRGLGDLEMDDLIGAVMYVWAVRFNQGKLLQNKDLLRGETLAPIAKQLSPNWAALRYSLLLVTDTVRGRGLEYGPKGHYSSLNALVVMWAWFALTRFWSGDRALGVTQGDAYEKLCEATLASHLDRWLFCSHWAGRWAGSSASAYFPKYAMEMSETWDAVVALSDHVAAHETLKGRLAGFVDDLELPATQFIQTVAVDAREKVRAYKNLLWVWHRLEEERWEQSQIVLRVGRARKSSWDVDHLVAVALWERMADANLPADTDDQAAAGAVNGLGNTSLLEKSFNISKADKTLKEFLAKVHEFSGLGGEEALRQWASALQIPDALLDPTSVTLEEVAKAVADREKLIRAELIEFVCGQRTRADL